jgi:hypothetical protein
MANPQAALLQPGLHAFDPNSEIGRRLKTILGTINDYLTKAQKSMTNILAGQETPGGLILYDAFVTAIK